jgi:hypothetical protein
MIAAAFATVFAVWAFIMLTVVLPICAMSKRREQAAPFNLTPLGESVCAVETMANNLPGDALADALAEHLLAGGVLEDIIAGDVKWHPATGYFVELVTRDTVAAVGDEVEGWLAEGGRA